MELLRDLVISVIGGFVVHYISQYLLQISKKFIIGVVIIVIALLGIGWGVWSGNVPILLGVNLSIAIGLFIFLKARELPIWFIMNS